ncbi:uncharacterized protein LOC132739243 [Ruditapes philippinarum]|uniref:uncharacterized protein LOC132739243 n=1 Tax=Ruditapes philippinarum TaxID=129788 RepID=UPI00295B9A9F|nr:uncharacterized protein LOC132739243 [Ruditapes philippinarum]
MDGESEEEDDPLRLPAIKRFDSHSERKKKIEERNKAIDRIEAFEEKAVLRKQYLTEVMIWFEENVNMCANMVTPEEMSEMIRTSSQLHNVISKSLDDFITAGDLVVKKGKLLLEETSKIIAE